MPYEPRTSREIERSLSARLVARTALTDLADGSVIRGIAGAVAQELGGVEMRLARIRDSFYMDGATGADLDERVAELPGTFEPRLAATAASGVVSFTRSTAGAPLNVPVGSLLGRSDDETVLYQTTSIASFGALDLTATATIVATTPGAAGNCAAGVITRLVSVTAEVVGVSNTSALVNGQDQESDESLRARAYLHLSSLAQCQPGALEAFALGFVSSTGARLTFARVFEDVSQPGYSELIVDDGSGAVGSTRPGTPITASSGVGQIVVWMESPVVGSVQYTYAGGIVPAALYTLIPERGLLYPDTPLLGFPDVWGVGNYEVYTGIIAELQAAIENRRAAGTRVRVLPPTVQQVYLSIGFVPRSGVDASVERDAVLTAALSYISGLGPGEPLYIARLIGALVEDPNLLNVFIREPDGITPASDVYPPSARYVLRGSSATVAVVLEVVP